MISSSSEKIQCLRHLITESEKIVVFTGAGVSTESGISDFRSKGGLWDRFQPVRLSDILR